MELAEFRSSLDRWLDENRAVLARDDVTIGDGAESERWRAEYLYSRAASIYGGSGEIQRNIIARQLLDLGADR